MKKRIFIGIPLGTNIIEELHKSLSPLNKFEDEFFWIPDENWHITLAFIGDVDEAIIPKIEEIFSGFTAEQRYFNIYFDGAQLFPSKKSAKKIVLTMVKNRTLMDLQFRFKSDLAEFLPEEERTRKFFPHVSIANIKRGTSADLAAKVEELEFKKRFEVDRLAILETIWKGRPPVLYNILSEVKMVVDDKFIDRGSEDESF